MNKDSLVKHHFWILLGLAIVLLPVISCSVISGVAEATDKQAKAVEDKKKALAIAKPKGELYVNELESQKNELESSKGTVWKENYDKQKGLIHWPAALSHLDNLYFGDAIDDRDINTFRKPEVYVAEFQDLAARIKPTELSGGWEKIMSYVKWGDKNPSPEEAWLALEDLCIQRELLDCVHEVNMLLAQCERATGPEVEKQLQEDLKPTSEESAFRFVNPYWRLDLAVRRAGENRPSEFIVRGKLTNISNHRQSIGRIDFNIALFNPKETQGKWGMLGVEGDFLQVGHSINIKDTIIRASATEPAKPTIYAVEQKLEPRNVPVKRVERIALGYHSHRTADKALVISAMSEEAKKATPPPADTAPAPGGAAPAAPAIDKTPSGINRSRYMTVTPQVRRMPIGMVLIVDQAHVQDVLRAFANSRLRFQTTQFHCARYRGGPGAGPSDATNANLVEMSLYGLISIYEKFPPKGAPGAAPAKTS